MIELIASAGYRRWLETLDTKPTVRVHRAVVLWPDGIERGTHLKISMQNDHLPSRHLINEAIGWVLARCAGLPVAEHAAFMELSPQQVADAHPDLGDTAGTVAWLTSSEPTMELRASGEQARDLFSAEIALWPLAADTAAFDEWLGNGDRHPGNLLRRAARDFALIDHDNILTGAHWLADMLYDSRNQDFNNELMALLERAVPCSSDQYLALINAAANAADDFGAALPKGCAEIEHWLTELVDNPTEGWSAAGFLAYRARCAGALVRRRYGLLA